MQGGDRVMTKLISYKSLPINFFGDSYEFPYLLLLKKTKLFGFIEYEEEIVYTISMFQSIKTHTDNWDNLIKTGIPIK